MELSNICQKAIPVLTAVFRKTFYFTKTVIEEVVKHSFLNGFIKITERVERKEPHHYDKDVKGRICADCCTHPTVFGEIEDDAYLKTAHKMTGWELAKIKAYRKEHFELNLDSLNDYWKETSRNDPN